MIDLSKKKLLVIAPHYDDEVLMAGGLMQMCAEVMVIVVASDSKSVLINDIRYNESFRALSSLSLNKFDIRSLGQFDGSCSSTPTNESAHKYVVTQLDQIIKEYNPNIIVIPEPSHHQDHLFTYEVSLSACRPGSNESNIDMILVGSYPYSDIYPIKSTYRSYMYFRLNEVQYTNKLKAMSSYESQLSSNPRDALSIHAISTIMKMRGVESCTEYAERFEVLRLII